MRSFVAVIIVSLAGTAHADPKGAIEAWLSVGISDTVRVDGELDHAGTVGIGGLAVLRQSIFEAGVTADLSATGRRSVLGNETHLGIVGGLVARPSSFTFEALGELGRHGVFGGPGFLSRAIGDTNVSVPYVGARFAGAIHFGPNDKAYVGAFVVYRRDLKSTETTVGIEGFLDDFFVETQPDFRRYEVGGDTIEAGLRCGVAL